MNERLQMTGEYHIQDFYLYKMEHDKVSPNTIHHYQANIHRALQHAVKTERIKSNPADNVDLPKKQKHIADFYTADELKTLLHAARDTEIEAVVMIAVWFGLRRGEIIGLKWNCIDFENRTISVRGTMAKTNKMIYKETAKNRSSVRTLPMTEEATTYSPVNYTTTSGEELFVLTFKVLETATVNTHEITLDFDASNICDENGELVEMEVGQGSVTTFLYVCGDVDSDLSITGADVVLLSRYLIGLETEIGEGADVNKDGKIDGRDLVKLSRHIVDIELIENIYNQPAF